MSSHKTRRYTLLLFIIPACLGVIVIVHTLLGIRNLADDSTIACAEGLHAGMTGDEIADFFGLPLVAIHPVPDFVNPEPQVVLDVYYDVETPVCGLEIQYRSQLDNTINISISIFHGSASNAAPDWHCIDYPEDIASGSGSFVSICSTTMTINDQNVFVTISTQESSDGTLEYANRLVLASD